MYKVYFSIGGNIGCKKENMHSAISNINYSIGKILKISSWYLTEPHGFKDNNYFLNAALVVETELYPLQILEKISQIEIEHLRQRNSLKKKFSSRTLDIDILFYENCIINDEKLIIPHPSLHLRNFVLYPLSEIAKNYIHPIFNKTVYELKNSCTDASKLRKINLKI